MHACSISNVSRQRVNLVLFEEKSSWAKKKKKKMQNTKHLKKFDMK